MANLTFIVSETRTGRGFLACKEICKVATFENDIPSVGFLIKDTKANKGLKVVGARTTKGGFIVGISSVDGLDIAEDWSLSSYKVKPNEDEALGLSGLPDGLDGIVVEEI